MKYAIEINNARLKHAKTKLLYKHIDQRSGGAVTGVSRELC